MSFLLLSHPKTRATGRLLAQALGIPHASKIRPKHANISHVIRWGNAQEIPATYREGDRMRPRVEINTRKAVALASSKYRALVALRDADVPVPRFTQCGTEALLWQCSTILGRSFRHMRGTDIEIFNTPDYDVELEEPNSLADCWKCLLLHVLITCGPYRPVKRRKESAVNGGRWCHTCAQKILG